MSEENSNKTPKNRSEAVTRYKEKNNRKPISIDLYLEDSKEKELYEFWKKIPNKKQFLINAIERERKK